MSALHLVDEHGNPLCPEALARDAMTDDEFWEHVFPSGVISDDFEGRDLDAPGIATPCPVCGSITECGYDADGLPMIHALPDEDEA